MRWSAAFLLVFSCRAAVVSGVVVEDETGYALAWSQVSLLPLTGTNAAAVTVRTGMKGVFSFDRVSAGMYILRSTREGFADSEAGQMRPGRPGIPFQVTTDGRNYFQMRMRRMAAITGSLLDHNNVGVPDWPVQILTAHKPFRRVASGVTDDRGAFRIGLLEQGSYVVRSGGGTLEDGTSLLPSYFPYGATPVTAEPVRARVGQTRTDVIIRVLEGHLLGISGTFSSPVPAQLSLVTQSGRSVIASVTTGGPVPFAVKELPPGLLELTGEGSQCGSYQLIDLERDTSGLRIGCSAMAKPSIDWAQSPPCAVAVHRLDLDQTGPDHWLREGEPLLPGRYEMRPEPGPGRYVESILGASNSARWYALDIIGSQNVTIRMAAHPASLRGQVFSGGAPVAGAPVYLEKVGTPGQPERWTLRADAQGNYVFEGLAPGDYRLISSFDYDPEDERLTNSGSVITLQAAGRITQPLEMVIP